MHAGEIRVHQTNTVFKSLLEIVLPNRASAQGWLDSAGHPQTESLRITERLRRRDFGHMDFEMTIDDPKVFTRPFTVKTERLLAADTDLLEDVCFEFIKDAQGRVTHLMVRGAAGDQKAGRKGASVPAR